MNISTLESAFRSLEEGYGLYTGNTTEKLREALADSCIKRFEFTLETSVKAMRRFLKETYGVDEKDLTINNIFRLMEGYGYILSWTRWREYYQKRNDTVHDYSLSKAHALLALLPTFIEDARYLVQNLRKKLGD